MKTWILFLLCGAFRAAGAEPGAPIPSLPGMSADTVPQKEEPAMPKPPQSAAPPAAPAAPPEPTAPSAAATPSPETPSVGGNLPTEVIIKGSDSSKLKVSKPPLQIDSDAFDSIRASLKPEESLLLAESPLTVSWHRTHPEVLNNARVVEPWRTTFSERAGIAFYPLEQLSEALGRKLDSREAKAYQWSLNIADEEGRVFQHYEGSSDPPEELLWSGQNDQGEWIKAGRSYSPIFLFTDPSGSPRTKVGKTLQFTGIVHQESDGLHVSLDSTMLFGNAKAGQAVEKNGIGLLRSAADLVKRRYSGIPLQVQAYASTKELAESQATAVQQYLLGDLMVMPQTITAEGHSAAFSEQRVEIVLLNR